MSRCAREGSSRSAARAELAGLASGGKVDDRFKDKVLLPGFVEGHSHIMEGMMWSLPYVGAGDRRSREGRLVEGVRDIEAIVARLKQAEAEIRDADAPLFAWGFDPLHIGGHLLRGRTSTASRRRGRSW